MLEKRNYLSVADSGGSTGNGKNDISISIDDTSWTSYISYTTLACRKNQKVRLMMHSGGIAAGGMLVDGLGPN